MAGKARDRQRQARQARMAELNAERRKASKQRLVVGIGVAVLVIVAAVLVVAMGGGDGGGDGEGGGDPQVAAGKGCVAVADPLPAGAPEVPVKVGAPPTSLTKEDLSVGDGAEVMPGATVTVNYIGVSCSTGKIFDSSYSRNQPATFSLDQVITGWKDGIPGMKVHGRRLLGIPPDQAYGPTGSPPDIGPNETLWFVVEVLDTKPA